MSGVVVHRQLAQLRPAWSSGCCSLKVLAALDKNRSFPV